MRWELSEKKLNDFVSECGCVCVSVYTGSLPDTDSHDMPRASN